ncbi:hypothetical protein AAFC00_004426 [Neodothiora populina]
MIVARGSTESPGTGTLLSPLISAVESHLPGSDHVAVDYPASLARYADSVYTGVSNMTKLVQSHVAACPKSKIVLLGYSQGAQVAGDTVCGTTSAGGFTQTSALASKYSTNVIAVVMFGDPANVSGLSFDKGNATSNGLFPRTSLSACTGFASKVQSYCDDGDAYCDSGLYLAPHYQYINNHGFDAAEFICSQADAAGVGTCST